VGLNAGRLIDRIRLTDRQESDPVGDDGLANHEQITTFNANTGTGVDHWKSSAATASASLAGTPPAAAVPAAGGPPPGCAALGARTEGGGSLSQGALRACRDSPRDSSTIGAAIE